VAELVVEVAGLVKRYGATRAVDGLSLSVERGTVAAVLGPNGAGKTTTLECCEGYRKPDGGTVRVLGMDPIRDGRALRPRIGVMLQSGGVYTGARALEMLRHVARLHANPLDVGMLAETLGLGATGRTTYRRLSGGQQQRLALALAVVGRPEVVFLDEPTAGLDPLARRTTWALIEELRADGVTVVLSTHHMEEAERLADHVWVIDRGEVVADGSPAALAAMGSEDLLRFGGPPRLDLAPLLLALPEGCAAKESSPGQYVVEGPMGPQLLATVTAWCAANGVMPENLVVGRRSLEEVFLELTGGERL
jgi:ABC-2 type transport system ATP-binding protein